MSYTDQDVREGRRLMNEGCENRLVTYLCSSPVFSIFMDRVPSTLHASASSCPPA